MTRATGKRRFHFKNILPKDPALLRFGEWPSDTIRFYQSFREWLKASGYSDSALGIYGSAARTAIGFLRKPYWSIDPDADITRAKEYIAQRGDLRPGSRAGHFKGLNKFADYIRLRCHRPKREKPILWQNLIGALPPALQNDVREFIAFCQLSWIPEQRHERACDKLYSLARPLRWMAQYRSLNDVLDLTPQVWYAYLDERIRAGIHPATTNRELSALKHFVHFLQVDDRAVCERFLLVDYLDDGDSLPKDVPLDQLRKLQSAIRMESSSPHAGRRRLGTMDLAWFLLMLHCGLRSGEVRRLKMTDIQWDSRRVRIEQSKGLKDRQIYLTDAILEALRSYLAVRGPAQALPENVFIFRHAPLTRTYCFQRLRTYGARCGVKAAPHRLRHSCATLLLNAGAPALSLQMILGHKQIDTTLGYARLYDGTIAADYYSAMNKVERQLALPEDRTAEPPDLGQLIALTDALRNGSLNPAQTEIVRALREGLGLLEAVSCDPSECRRDVKVREVKATELFANSEIL
jgi:integrase/recombinase XerD